MQAAFTSLLLDWVKIGDSGMFALFIFSPSLPYSQCGPGPFSIYTPLPYLQHFHPIVAFVSTSLRFVPDSILSLLAFLLEVAYIFLVDFLQ